jgi:dipeptide/tripeptide permease
MVAMARSPVRRHFILSIVASGFAYAVNATYTSLLAVYLHDTEAKAPALSLSALIIGTSFLMSVFLASIADRRPSFPVALALLSLGAASLTYSAKVGFLLIILGTGLLRPAIMSRIAKARPEGMSREQAFRFLVGTINLAYIAGPLLADELRFRAGWYWVHISMAAIAGLAALFGVARIGRERPEASPQRDIKRINRLLLVILVAVTLFYGIAAQCTGALSLLVEQDTTPLSIGPWTYVLHAGGLAAVHGLLVLAGSFICRLRSTISSATLSVLGLVVYSAAFALLGGIGYPASQWWLIAAFILLSAGETIVSPSLLAFGSRIAGGRRGLYWLASGAGYGIGGAVGVLWERWSHASYFGTIAGACLVVASLVLWRARDPEWG